jgi:hypothetical protein
MGPHSVHRSAYLLAMGLHIWGFFCYFLCRIVFSKGLEFIPRDKTAVFCNHVPGFLFWRYFSFHHINFISFYLLAPPPQFFFVIFTNTCKQWLSTFTLYFCIFHKVQQSLYRPWGFNEVEAIRFQDNRLMKVVRLSAIRTGRLYPPGNIPGTHFWGS